MSVKEDLQIVVCGLGYVGLPLAVEFGKKYPTLGFDINKQRVSELKTGLDKTLEQTSEEIKSALYLGFTSDVALHEWKVSPTVFIVTVPTPIDAYKKPDLKPLLSVSQTIGQVLKKGDIVI